MDLKNDVLTAERKVREAEIKLLKARENLTFARANVSAARVNKLAAEKYRECMVIYDSVKQGHSVNLIAQDFGCSPTCVRRKLRRAERLIKHNGRSKLNDFIAEWRRVWI